MVLIKLHKNKVYRSINYALHFTYFFGTLPGGVNTVFQYDQTNNPSKAWYGNRRAMVKNHPSFSDIVRKQSWYTYA